MNKLPVIYMAISNRREILSVSLRQKSIDYDVNLENEKMRHVESPVRYRSISITLDPAQLEELVKDIK